MRIKFDCGINEFGKMKNVIDHYFKNGESFEFCEGKYSIRSFEWGRSHDTVIAEIEMYKIEEVDINEGDYVRVTDRTLENDYKLNSNFIYKVDYTRKDCTEKYLKLCGIKDTLFKAKLFEKVEVK